MSSNASNTRITLSAVAARLDAHIEAQNEHNEAVTAILTRLTTGTQATTTATPEPAKASKGKAKGKKAKAQATTPEGPTFKEQQEALRALKALGKAPAGMTVKQAVEAGLIRAYVTPKAEPKAEVATATKATATSEGTPFGVLKAALKAHKASGAVPSQHNGTYVTVKSAIADGLMLADGSLPKGKGKGKGAQVVAVVEDAAPARRTGSSVAANGPRRADGTITPKREWALRERLAAQGLSAKKIDKKVAKAMEVLGS